MRLKQKNSPSGKKITRSVTESMEEERSRKPPPNAKITRRTVSTSTEPIENGFLIVKNFSGTYKDGKEDRWFDYSQKYFSKTDPMNVDLSGKELADAFEDEP
jgi:hypothetical protein